MANRSTFNTTLPRDIKRLVDLSPDASGYTKRQLADAVDFNHGNIPVIDTTGNKVQRFVVLPNYDRMLRLLMAEAHGAHRRYKLKRLTKESSQPSQAESAAA
jgi:hypothetical protein